MMRRIFPIALLLFATIAAAQKSDRAAISTALNYTALKPGQRAMLAIVVDIRDGFHAQSHTPLDENFIPMTLRMEGNSRIELQPPIFPAGKIEDFAALGKLSIYSGRVIVYVPIDVKRDAAVGELKISGVVSYQICDDRGVIAPEKTPVEVSTQIISADQTPQPSHPELFSGFNSAAATTSFQTLLAQFSLAFVVGIIFNAMPCVLPVVPLKIMGFYEVSQHNRRKSLAWALFSASV